MPALTCCCLGVCALLNNALASVGNEHALYGVCHTAAHQVVIDGSLARLDSGSGYNAGSSALQCTEVGVIGLLERGNVIVGSLLLCGLGCSNGVLYGGVGVGVQRIGAVGIEVAGPQHELCQVPIAAVVARGCDIETQILVACSLGNGELHG